MKRLTMEYEDKTVSLLPCPFCGSDPLIHSYRRHGLRYSVRCGNEFGHCRMNPRTQDYLELGRAAGDWNMRPPEPNAPLTLEELRGMDGEPVWVEWLENPNLSCWAIRHHELSDGYYSDFFDCDYGKEWLAYRRKPEEGMSA